MADQMKFFEGNLDLTSWEWAFFGLLGGFKWGIKGFFSSFIGFFRASWAFSELYRLSSSFMGFLRALWAFFRVRPTYYV
jgi:hypothetical protein